MRKTNKSKLFTKGVPHVLDYQNTNSNANRAYNAISIIRPDLFPTDGNLLKRIATKNTTDLDGIFQHSNRGYREINRVHNVKTTKKMY